MDANHTYDEPSKVEAEDGVVTVDGPDGVDVNLTPEAAAETSDRLLEKSAEARGQRYLGKLGIHGPKKSQTTPSAA